MSAGFLLVLSGPSGSGKGTVSEALMKKNSEIVFSTSVTTRTPRPGEVNGQNYFSLVTTKCPFIEINLRPTNFLGRKRLSATEPIATGCDWIFLVANNI